MCAAFGWTYHYVYENLSLAHVDSIQSYLKDNPPLHRMVAHYLGYKKADKVKQKQPMSDLARAFGPPVKIEEPKFVDE